jgi:hypothetical protein
MSVAKRRALLLVRMRQLAVRQARAQLMGAAAAQVRIDAHKARLSAVLDAIGGAAPLGCGLELARAHGLRNRLIIARGALVAEGVRAAAGIRSAEAALARREAERDAGERRADAQARMVAKRSDQRQMLPLWRNR